MIEEVFQLTRFIAASKNIDLIYTNLNILGHIFSDQKRLKQVLLNLVTNALKFTFKGSVCVNV
jgi:signal transduction histidine kinase